jgi:hypothetical protein
MPAGEKVFKWIGCSEVATEGTRNINVRSYHNSDGAQALWNTVGNKPANYLVAFVTNDGYISQFYPVTKSTVDMNIQPQTAANAKGSRFFEGVLSVSALDIPVLVPPASQVITGAPAPPAPQTLLEFLLENIERGCV